MKKYVRHVGWWVLLVTVVGQVPAWSATPAQQPALSQQNPSSPGLQMTDIHDIRGPEQWGIDPAWITWGVIAAIVLLLLILALWAVIRWKRKKKSIQALIPEISPEDAAYALLDDIKNLMLEDEKAYYFKLSEVLRGYMANRFEFDALEMTSEELLPVFMGLDIDPQMKKDVKALILFSDPVKFAGKRVETAQMEKHHALTHAFVRETALDMSRGKPDDGNSKKTAITASS